MPHQKSNYCIVCCLTLNLTSKGRSNDNAHIEQFWRTTKYEWLFINNVKTIREVKNELPKLLAWYNNERSHQSINYLTPKEKADGFMDKFKKLTHNFTANNNNYFSVELY